MQVRMQINIAILDRMHPRPSPLPLPSPYTHPPPSSLETLPCAPCHTHEKLMLLPNHAYMLNLLPQH